MIFYICMIIVKIHRVEHCVCIKMVNLKKLQMMSPT